MPESNETESKKSKKSIIVEGRAGSLANYPHAKQVGDLLFISGISSRRPDNTHDGVTIHPDGTVDKDIKLQTRAVIQNIEAILNAADMTLNNLVDLTVFLVDMSDYQAFNQVYNEFFDAQTGPARTTVAVKELPHPNLLIEIKALAAR